nr:MAG TPA: hypothetical protein [Caudoviricetes sp.]
MFRLNFQRLIRGFLKLLVFPSCHFLSSCHHLINRRWLAVQLCHYIFMCLDNRHL